MVEKLLSLAKDTAIYGLGSIIGRFLGIFLIPIYTRLLSPADYGVLDIISTATGIMIPLLILGLEAAVPFYYYNTIASRAQRTMLSTAFFFRIAISSIVCALLLFSIKNTSGLLFSDVEKSQDFNKLLQIAILSIPFNVAVLFYQTLLRAQRRPWQFAILTLTQLFLVISLNLYFVVWLKIGIAGVLWSNLIANIFLSLFGLIMISSSFTLSFSFSWLKQLLTYGLPLVPVSIAYWVLAYADRYFLLQYTTLDEIGLYSVANKLSNFLAIFSGAFQLAWPPFAFSIMKNSQHHEIYAKTLIFYLTGMTYLAIIIALMAREILQIVTTPAYIGAYSVVGLLCLGLIANGSFYIIGVGLSITKKTHHLAWITILTAGLNIGLNFIFIPGFGIVGAALATTLSFTFSAIILYLIAQEHYFIPYNMKKAGYIYFIGIVMILSGLVIDSEIPQTSFSLLFTKFLLSSVVFLLLLIGTGVFSLIEIKKGLSALTLMVKYSKFARK